MQMQAAIQADDGVTIGNLIDSGISPNGVIQIERWLQWTYLGYACLLLKVNAIDTLLARGAFGDDHTSYQSPLCSAIVAANARLFDRLIAAGAKIEGQGTPYALARAD